MLRLLMTDSENTDVFKTSTLENIETELRSIGIDIKDIERRFDQSPTHLIQITDLVHRISQDIVQAHSNQNAHLNAIIILLCLILWRVW